MSKTILVVDDDYDFLEQTKIRLQSQGFEVITAENEEEAETLIEENNFDAAIVDIMLENDDAGFILAYKIKSKNQDKPVIITSAVTKETGLDFDAETEEEKSWIKADTFLSKPIRYEQLYNELNKLMD